MRRKYRVLASVKAVDLHVLVQRVRVRVKVCGRVNDQCYCLTCLNSERRIGIRYIRDSCCYPVGLGWDVREYPVYLGPLGECYPVRPVDFSLLVAGVTVGVEG